MGKIHPTVLVIIGLVIGGISAYMTYAMDMGSFLAFMIIGCIIFSYGLIMYFLRAPQPKEKHTAHSGKQSHPLEQWLRSCPYCKAKIPSNAIFCSYCGRRL